MDAVEGGESEVDRVDVPFLGPVVAAEDEFEDGFEVEFRDNGVEKFAEGSGGEIAVVQEFLYLVLIDHLIEAELGEYGLQPVAPDKG